MRSFFISTLTLMLAVCGLVSIEGFAKEHLFNHHYQLTVQGDNNPVTDFDIDLQFAWVDGAVGISLPIINFKTYTKGYL
jgi:hypothetical protein